MIAESHWLVLEAGINWDVTVGYELEVVVVELEEKGQARARGLPVLLAKV